MTEQFIQAVVMLAKVVTTLCLLVIFLYAGLLAWFILVQLTAGAILEAKLKFRKRHPDRSTNNGESL